MQWPKEIEQWTSKHYAEDKLFFSQNPKNSWMKAGAPEE